MSRDLRYKSCPSTQHSLRVSSTRFDGELELGGGSVKNDI
jgi:hypothetical protein